MYERRSLGHWGGSPPPNPKQLSRGTRAQSKPKRPQSPQSTWPPPPPKGGRATPSPLGVPRENWERSLGNESPKGIRLVSHTERGEEGRSPPGEQSPGDPPIGPLPPIPFHYQRISKLAPPNPSRAIPPKGPSVEEWAGDPPPPYPLLHNPGQGGVAVVRGGGKLASPPPLPLPSHSNPLRESPLAPWEERNVRKEGDQTRRGRDRRQGPPVALTPLGAPPLYPSPNTRR